MYSELYFLNLTIAMMIGLSNEHKRSFLDLLNH